MTTAAFSSSLRKWRWTVAALLVAAMEFTYFVMPWILGLQVTLVAVRTGNIIQTLVATRTIANPRRVEIGPQDAGRMTNSKFEKLF
jgi:hypothetical protein